MAIENINDYAGMWANGVNIGQLWDKIKEKFVSGAHVQSDATTYPASWKQQARANIGLTIGANKMWYGSAANTIGEVTTSTFGRGLLNTSSGTEVTGLFAETAEKDKNGIEISENYAHSLAITEGYLRLKNNRYVSGTASAQDLSALQLNVKLGLLQLDDTGSAGKIPLVHIPDSIMGQLTYGGTITAYTQGTDSLTVSITTGAKAILEQKTGRTIGNKTVKLVATATDPSDTSSIAYFNYADCTGIYFIWTADALTTHTGEPDYRVWPSGGPRYQAGDWLISNDTKWDKVDNTDAVTGVKGSNESAFRLGNVSIDALDVRALATYLTNTTQTVADKVQFNKDIWSLGGVAAYGISDLSAGGGGGGGLSGTIIRNWSNYQGAETEVLGANLGMRGFRMSGYSFQVNKPAVGADNWQTEFTLGTENIPDLPLTQITGTTELRKIETLSATGTPSGFLKRASNGNWSFDTNSYALASALNDYLPLSGGTLTGNLTINKSSNPTLRFEINGTHTGGMFVDANGNRIYHQGSGTPQLGVFAGYNSPYFRYSGTDYKVWHEGNDGSDSGLDADLLDGKHASELFALLENDNDQLSATIGTTNKKLTLDYAKKASRMRTEIKADQEFVYRQSPQTIDADSLVINKFKGRTVAWNQQFSLSSVAGQGATISNGSDNSKVATKSGSSAFTMYNFATSQSIWNTSSHKFYCAARIKANATGEVVFGLVYYVGSGVVGFSTTVSVNSTNYTRASFINTANANNQSVFGIVAPNSLSSFTCKDIICVDLTLLFNGNVPSGYTAADFERDFPDYLTAFNAGELRNNDAKAIETAPAGFNLWDEECQDGAWYTNNGEYNPNATQYTSTKNKIRIVGGGRYYTHIGTMPSTQYYFWFDINNNFISSDYGANQFNTEVTAPVNAAYVGLSWTKDGYGTTYNHDICINLSDSAKNGTYEPYRRIVTDLNLDAIQVKSHNIWDEEWESGAINNDGSEAIATTYTRAKNYLRVSPNTSYYFKSTQALYAYEYDKDLNAIGWLNSTDNNNCNNRALTTKSNTAYLRFFVAGASLTANDICINESSSFNGQYEPHGILTINGLKQAGSVYDEIVENKLIQRIGTQSLNQMSWTWESSNQQVYSYSLQDFVSSSSFGGVAVICNRLEVNTANYVALATTHLRGFNNRVLYVSTPSQIGPSDLVGYEINYELATPIEYELASPIPDTMPAGTTERIISDRLPVTPFACDMTYGANPKDILASAVPFSRLQGVRLERGAFTMSTQNDSNWYLVTLGDKKLYLRFTVNTGAFKLEMASDDTENPEYSKSFEFATLSTSEIDAICV